MNFLRFHLFHFHLVLQMMKNVQPLQFHPVIWTKKSQIVPLTWLLQQRLLIHMENGILEETEQWITLTSYQAEALREYP